MCMCMYIMHADHSTEWYSWIEWTNYVTPLNLCEGSRRVQIGVPQNKPNVKVDLMFMEPHIVIEHDYGGMYSTL